MSIGRRSWDELPSEREESSWASAMDNERCTTVGEHGGQEGRPEPAASAVQWRWRLYSGGVENGRTLRWRWSTLHATVWSANAMVTGLETGE